MVRSLASDTGGETLDAVHSGDAAESDLATPGQAIIPPEQDERLRPVFFYVAVAKKTIN